MVAAKLGKFCLLHLQLEHVSNDCSGSDLRQLTTLLVVTKPLVSKVTSWYFELTELTKLTLARASLAVCRAPEVRSAGIVDFWQGLWDYGAT